MPKNDSTSNKGHRPYRLVNQRRLIEIKCGKRSVIESQLLLHGFSSVWIKEGCIADVN